ncbi:helix-turn-helix domain-containing protein [Glutamicibacter sp. NPDC055491]
MSTHESHIDDLRVNFEELLSDPKVAEAVEDADIREDLIDALIALRKSADIRQKDVAKHMQCTQSTISDFENGTSDPHLSTLQRYARAIGHKLTIEVEKCEGSVRKAYAEPYVSVSPVKSQRAMIDEVLSKDFVKSYAEHESRKSDFATAA